MRYRGLKPSSTYKENVLNMRRQNLILLLFIFVCMCPSTYAQKYLQEKRIYLVDVTKSMAGKGIIPTPDIFESVKASLIEAISELEDPNTEIIVIPFTNKPHQMIHGYVSQKDSLVNVLKSLDLKQGDTNVADAWTQGIACLDSTKVNYMFLLTDGLHNCGPSQDELFERLKQWESIRSKKYFFAFYVMLTENALDQQIRAIADLTAQMWCIQSLNINAALIRTSLVHRSNIFEDKTIQVKFVSNNSSVFVDDLGLSFALQDNDYYSISSTRRDSANASIYAFDVIEKVNKINIPVDVNLMLHINHNQTKYPLVFFTPEDIEFRIINRGVRRMTLKVVKK